MALSSHSAKIKNIISTEDAKARLLAEQQNKKKDSETSFVPTNMAVNYVQHNRCECPACPAPGVPWSPASCLTRVLLCSVYHEELNAPIRRNKEEPKARPLRVGDTEKPEPEREYSVDSTRVALEGRVMLGRAVLRP